jgi:hypothetical protein
MLLPIWFRGRREIWGGRHLIDPRPEGSVRGAERFDRIAQLQRAIDLAQPLEELLARVVADIEGPTPVGARDLAGLQIHGEAVLLRVLGDPGGEPESIYAFRGVMPAIEALGPLIAIDLPGFGRSEGRATWLQGGGTAGFDRTRDNR